MLKSFSLKRAHGFSAVKQPDGNRSLQESPKVRSPPSEQIMENGKSMVVAERVPSIKRQDSFEMRLPELPKIDVHSLIRQTSNTSDPESPISPLLTSDPNNERSHSSTYSRPCNQYNESPVKRRRTKDSQHLKPPSFWRLVELSFTEWLYALLGSIGAAIFGSFNPMFAYTVALIMAAYYRVGVDDVKNEVNKWCLIIACLGLITVLANFLQHFYFGIMGEKMTERVRRMMFSGN